MIGCQLLPYDEGLTESLAPTPTTAFATRRERLAPVVDFPALNRDYFTRVKRINQERPMLTAGWVLHGFVAFVLITSGFTKMTKPPKRVQENFKKWNLLGWMRMIGFGELISGVLLAVPLTSPFGMLVASASWGGAIVVHMVHNEPFVPPAVFLLMVWIGAALKYPALFGLG